MPQHYSVCICLITFRKSPVHGAIDDKLDIISCYIFLRNGKGKEQEHSHQLFCLKGKIVIDFLDRKSAFASVITVARSKDQSSSLSSVDSFWETLEITEWNRLLFIWHLSPHPPPPTPRPQDTSYPSTSPHPSSKSSRRSSG